MAMVLVGVVGCGGSGGVVSAGSQSGVVSGSTASSVSGGSAVGGGVSAASFVARAEAICRATNTALARLGAASGGDAGLVRGVPQHASLERLGLTKLEGLVPPAALAGGWHRLLGYRTTLLGELGELVRAARVRDRAAILRLAVSKARVHKALREAAARSGFRECALVG